MKKIIALGLAMLCLALCAGAKFERINTYNGEFSDVKENNWFYEDVKTAYELGFMNGKGEGTFDPDGKVTLAEGIALAARLHASYNETKVTEREYCEYEHRIDFDDPSFLVDLTKRNSRNDNGVNFYRAHGEMRDGYIVLTPEMQKNGVYDPGLLIEGLNLDTRNYNKITFRMKFERLENENGKERQKDVVQIFFKTSSAPSLDEKKSIKVDLSGIENTSEWFEISVDAFTNSLWKDVVRGIRFDTTSNNGVYYVDSIVFSKSENSPLPKWYEKYYDYAFAHGIIDAYAYPIAEVERNITRGELCELVAASLDEKNFAAVNDIKGIPDLDRHSKNADVFLMLYKAGILLGSDSDGSLKQQSDIKRSELAAVVNRAALPENRVRGELSADWTGEGTVHDVEFEDSSVLSMLSYEAKSINVSDGSLVLEAKQRDNGKYDPKIILPVNIPDARKYTGIRIRMKPCLPENTKPDMCQLFFMNNGDDGFSESKSVRANGVADASGWLIYDVDLRLNTLWNGEITGLRLDPAGSGGVFHIDYIRFVEGDYFKLSTMEELETAGYTPTRLLQDEHFERGFYVSAWDGSVGIEHGIWQDYCGGDEKPLWRIFPAWTKADLIDDRDTTTDKYTIADNKGASTVTYNPKEKSLTMRVNATKIYGGEPYIYEEDGCWAHLLLEQNSSFAPVDKKKNSAAADRMFVEIDIRCLDFKDTINREGTNNPSFLIYFYLVTDKAPGQKIWFGLRVFNGTTASDTANADWAPDTAAHQYMYGIPQAALFGGIKNSFNTSPGVVDVGEEWKKIRLDVTPHIRQAVEWANRDNIFGIPVAVGDMYFGGVNIGFETWGNYDYTFEFKNFNMIAYNASEPNE